MGLFYGIPVSAHLHRSQAGVATRFGTDDRIHRQNAGARFTGGLGAHHITKAGKVGGEHRFGRRLGGATGGAFHVQRSQPITQFDF